MSDIHTDAGIAAARQPGRPALRRAADWICLAAAPAFAGMAVITAAIEGGAPGLHSMAGHGTSPLGGMPLMYALMAIVHSAPWLRRFSGRPAPSQGGFSRD